MEKSEKCFCIPVSWEMKGYIKVFAKTEEDAVNKIYNNTAEYDLPLNDESTIVSSCYLNGACLDEDILKCKLATKDKDSLTYLDQLTSDIEQYFYTNGDIDCEGHGILKWLNTLRYFTCNRQEVSLSVRQRIISALNNMDELLILREYFANIEKESDYNTLYDTKVNIIKDKLDGIIKCLTMPDPV